MGGGEVVGEFVGSLQYPVVISGSLLLLRFLIVLSYCKYCDFEGSRQICWRMYALS